MTDTIIKNFFYLNKTLARAVHQFSLHAPLDIHFANCSHAINKWYNQFVNDLNS